MHNKNGRTSPNSVAISRQYLSRMSRNEWNVFQLQAELLLQHIEPPNAAISCTGKCTNSTHKKDLKAYFSSITRCLQDAFEAVKSVVDLPHRPGCSNNKRPRAIPGWSTVVTPLQTTMLRLHNEWKVSGLDSSSDVYKLYSAARRNYHAAIKAIVKNDKEMRTQAIVSKLAQSRNSKDFWNTLKKSFPKKSKLAIPSLDDGSTPDEISACNTWSQIFKKDFSLYSTESSKERFLSISAQIKDKQPPNSSCWEQNVVQHAMNLLALNKAPGPDEIFSEMITYAPLALAVHLSLLFRSCERHTYLPEALSEAHIHPVPKPHKDPYVFENYRPITIGSGIGKIFERCILIKYSEALSSSDLQFGFKKGISTSHCTLTVKAVAKYYTDNAHVHLQPCWTLPKRSTG